MIPNYFWPEEGRRHDMKLLRHSGQGEKIKDALVINLRQYYIYGDAPYFRTPWIHTSIDHAKYTDDQDVYKSEMGKVRVAVEWNYKDREQIWERDDFHGPSWFASALLVFCIHNLLHFSISRHA